MTTTSIWIPKMVSDRMKEKTNLLTITETKEHRFRYFTKAFSKNTILNILRKKVTYIDFYINGKYVCSNISLSE